jgi:hypothetical protein
MEATQKTINDEINRIGEDIKIHLNLQFKQWGTGLPFKTVFTKYSLKAKKLGYEVSMLSHVLQELGYIEIISTPSGKRWIFSKDSKLTPEAMSEIVLSEEARLESEKEMRKLRA